MKLKRAAFIAHKKTNLVGTLDFSLHLHVELYLSECLYQSTKKNPSWVCLFFLLPIPNKIVFEDY